jgi:uncharacterized protein
MLDWLAFSKFKRHRRSRPKLTLPDIHSDPLLPASTRCWALTDGKIGDEVQCLGIAEALGLTPECRHVAPRRHYAWAMPYGPIDPRQAPMQPSSPLAPPYPDLALAAGRRAVPYLTALKRFSEGRTFAVFIKDPYWSRAVMDVIVLPEHDRRNGENIITAVTPANRLTPAVFALARETQDPRLARLPRPRVALILGGDSQHHRIATRDIDALAKIALDVAQSGRGLMVTPSRRTPPHVMEAIVTALGRLPEHLRRNVFLWAGEEPNPYVAILANADAIIVTGDSVNMVGEAAATGAPVHVYEPSGGHPKIRAYLDRLQSLGAIRRWRGQIEEWRYAPINATPDIAAEIARRYRAFRTSRGLPDF